MMEARKMLAICMISFRASWVGADTLISTSSRRMARSADRRLTECTQISLRSWLQIRRACFSSVSSSMVMRDTAGSSVVPTAGESML